MHVGLNLIFLVPGETGGMEVYARELIAALRAGHPDLRMTAFANRELRGRAGPWDDLDAIVEVPVDARNRLQWVRGEQLLLPGLAARAGVDVLHSLASTAPARGAFRRVVTIHDLHYKVVPEAHFGLRGLGMRVLVPLAARRSDRIIAISHATAADLRTHLAVPVERIDVVHEGLGASADGVVPEREGALRERHALGDRPVVLSVSAKRPHKNLMRLIDAVAAIDAARRPVLVLPGYETPHEAELLAHARALGVADDVRMLHWVAAEELEGLYALASVFAFPSLYEGFGLPVLEAMARGVPVVCSDSSSLPELAGDAATLVSPHDVAGLTAALERVLDDPVEAERLRVAGRAQAARFSWERCAAGTVAAYRAAVGAG